MVACRILPEYEAEGQVEYGVLKSADTENICRSVEAFCRSRDLRNHAAAAAAAEVPHKREVGN